MHGMSLLKLLFTILFISHLFACMWIFVAEIEISVNDYSKVWLDNDKVTS